MKRLLVTLFILTLSIQLFAKIKAKHIVGTWTYAVQTDQGNMTGTLKFTKAKKSKLEGEVLTDDGTTIPMLKIEIRDGDVLYFEVQPDYEVLRVSMKIAGDSYEGTVATDQGEAPVTGRKQK